MAREVALTAPRRIAEPPIYSNAWTIAVMYGPHGAPDFFTPEDIETFFEADWKVHYNSSRTGIRLIGPKPKWARPDGGEAGLHPSNIHDNAYAIGAVDFTGDMPVILAVDGPSLGGFVCPVTIIQAELWKMGQLRPGDTVRFVPTTVQAAVEAELALDNWTTEGEGRQQIEFAPADLSSDRLLTVPEDGELPQAVYRAAGDKYLLVEYGPLVLDLNLRFRVHALMTALVDAKLPGVLDITPGIRSLQIHYDSRVLSMGELIDALTALERRSLRWMTWRCQPASCDCRSRGMIRRRSSRSTNTRNPCARTLHGVRVISSSSAASMAFPASRR